MRPLEALLLFVSLATLLALAVPSLRMARATRLLPFAVLLAAGAQVLLEGARWQMAPASIRRERVALSDDSVAQHEGSWRRQPAATPPAPWTPRLRRALRRCVREGYGLVRRMRGARGRLAAEVTHDRVALDLPLTGAPKAGR